MLRIIIAKSFLVCLLILLAASTSRGQQLPPAGEAGAPFVAHYSTRELGYDVTNWCVSRDARGMLWVGNSFGLLEFDGVSWRVIESVNNTPVYAVACADDGSIYFGLRGAFGKVRFKADGKAEMDMLSDSLPADAPMLTEFSEIHIIDGVVHFISAEAVCSWDGSRCSISVASHPIGRSYTSRGSIYAQIFGIGLCRFMNGEWEEIPGGEIFADGPDSDARIDPPEKIICLYHDARNRLIAGTRLRGIFRHDGSRFERLWDFRSVEDPLWLPTRGLLLPNGMLAIGSTHSGVYIFDQAGHVHAMINRNAGLVGGAVLSLFVDDEAMIWAALDDGVARIEWPSGPLTRFGAERGMIGQVTALQRFAGTIYASSTQGLYYLRAPENGQRASLRGKAFQLLPTVRTTVYDLLNIGDALLLSTTYGVYEMNTARRIRRISPLGARTMLPVRASMDTILVGHHHGLYYLIRYGTTWKMLPVTDRVEDYVLSLAEAGDGSIWVTTAQDGVRRIEPVLLAGPEQVHDFDSSDGLPNGPIFVATVQGQPIFINEERTRAFDPARKHFYPDTTFLHRFVRPLPEDPKFLFEDKTARIWLQLFESQSIGYALHKGYHRYQFTAAPFQRITEDLITVYTEANGICWFGTENAVYRYDGQISGLPPPAPHTLIRELSADGMTLYHGDTPGTSNSVLRIPDDAHRINIRFVSGNISQEESMLYRWRLEEIDSSWSPLAAWHTAEYHDLPAGDYHFRVQAVIPGEGSGEEASISFVIPRPWYQHWWMLLLILLAGIILALAAAHVIAKKR